MLDLGRPVELDDQQGIDIEGVTSMDEVLGRGDGEAVHHLHPGRDDAVRDHVGDALAGSSISGKPISSARAVSGLRRMRTVTWVTTPSSPRSR